VMEEDNYRYRKLTPIYNAIEVSSFRHALKLCSRKDVQDWAITKSLKAIALEKLGHREEAVEICREIKGNTPLDDHLLHTTSLTFRALGLHDEVTEMYAAAVARCPTLPILQIELFFCYNFLKQQQQASKLFKTLGDSKYLMWSAVSMLMQIREGGNPRLLELAEKLVYKSISERLEAKEPTHQEVLLYITILKEQRKYTEGVAALNDWDLGQGRGSAAIEDEDSLKAGSVVTIQRQELMALKADLLQANGELTQAKETFAELLSEDSDQWDLYLSYLDCALKGVQTPENSDTEFWTAVEPVLQFVIGLQGAKPHLRGPFLAEMELVNRVIQVKGAASAWLIGSDGGESKTKSCVNVLQARLQSYFEKFSNKLCCFSDMISALKIFAAATEASEQGVLLHRQQLNDFFCQTKDACITSETPNLAEEIDHEQKKEAINRLRTLVCALQLRRHLGAHEQATDEVLVEEINFAMREYNATLYLNQGSTGGQREVQYGDELVLVAAHILLDLASRAETEQAKYAHRVEAVLLLKMALNNSGYNYQMKLLLIEIYKELGAFEQGILLQNELEIKQIQVDSLSWLLLPGCLRSCYFEEARARCFGVNNFHRNTAGDVADGIRTAYDSGNFMKATEIIEFQQKRLNNSMQLAQCRSEMINLELLLNLHTVGPTTAFLKELVGGFSEASLNLSGNELDDLSINHDFGATVTYSYVDEKIMLENKRIKMTIKIRIRQVMAKLLLHALQGDTQKVLEDLPKAENLLQDAGYISSEASASSEVNIEEIKVQLDGTTLQEDLNGAVSLSEMRTAIWTLNLQGLRLLVNVHRCFEKTALTGDPSNLLGAITKFRETLEKIGSFCKGPRRAFSPWASDIPDDETGPLSSAWIKGVAMLLLDALPQTCVILLSAIELMPFKKKKGKKGKKGGSAPSDSPEVKQVKDAFKGTFEKVMKLLVNLKDVIKKEADGDSRREHFIDAIRMNSFLPFLYEEEHQELGRKVTKDIIQSNVKSAERTLEILKEKINVLQNVKLH